MGQAKWRKENDPNFGRIPKVPLRRGLIVCPPIEIQGTKLHLKSNQLDPEELRFAVLFWDDSCGHLQKPCLLKAVLTQNSLKRLGF